MAAQEDNPSPRRKRRTRSHVIEDLSENHLEYMVLKQGHLLRRPSRDYGVDVTMFHFAQSGELENGEVRFQLKASDSPKTTQGGAAVAVRVSIKDLQHWSFEAYPVVLVAFDASSESAYWINIQHYLAEEPARLKTDQKDVTIPVPVQNKLSQQSIEEFRNLSLAVTDRLLRARGEEDEPRKPK